MIKITPNSWFILNLKHFKLPLHFCSIDPTFNVIVLTRKANSSGCCNLKEQLYFPNAHQKISNDADQVGCLFFAFEFDIVTSCIPGNDQNPIQHTGT